MKKTMKKCLTLLLALAMLLAMAVPAAAEEPNYSRTITFTDVAQGDTVKAYKLVGYNATYTEYEFHGDFNNFVGQYYNTSGTLSTEDYLKDLDSTHMAALLAGYVNMCQIPGAAGNHALPTESATATADASNQVTLTLEPGYYVVLGSTTATNDRTYQLTSVFVQVKNGELKVIAGDGKTEIIDGEVQLKHTTGPIISMSVKDDKGTPAAWKGAAAGQVGEVLDFYIHLKLPDYNNDNVYMTKLALNNTLKGLQYVENSAGVYNTEEIAGATHIDNAVTVDTVSAYANGSQTVTFNLKYQNIKGTTGAVSAYLHFKAKVMPEAAAAGKTATAETKLDYTFSLDPTTSRTTSAVGVKVHTYAFSLAKLSDEQNAAGANLPLTNAGFTLYSDNTMTTPIKMVKVDATATTDAYYRPALTGETDIVTEMAANMGADQNTLLVRGLDAATYYLKETKVPAGYYAPKGGFAVQLTGEREAVNETLNGKLAAASSFTATNATDNVLLNGTASVNGTEMNRLDASLKNSSTPVLPTTGGVGTVMFTVIGLLCMGAALWFFLFARRRREDEQEQNKTTL
jgi:LPXTG-motif cell wall-anchored protein